MPPLFFWDRLKRGLPTKLPTKNGRAKNSRNTLPIFCSLNRDVETFLHNNAIEFAKQGIASAHLVSAFHRDKPVSIGYFTLPNKNIIVSNNGMSNTQRKRINKFGVYDPDRKGYRIAAPLIAQLGKNYSPGYDKLLTPFPGRADAAYGWLRSGSVWSRGCLLAVESGAVSVTARNEPGVCPGSGGSIPPRGH